MTPAAPRQVVRRLRTFFALGPPLFWGVYFAGIGLADHGLGWSGEVWGGTLVWTGLTMLGLTLLQRPAAPATVEPREP